MTLLHLVTPAEWASGEIGPGVEGFVHLSRPDQVHVPAGLLYAGRRDLVALVVDEAGLDGELRTEDGFPHLYGTLRADAVVDVVPFDHDIVFVPTPPDEAPVAQLLDAMTDEMRVLYPGTPATPLDRERLRAPEGAYLVGWAAGRPVAGGGFTRFDDGTAEVRRMYVAPDVRSRGVGRRLLGAVEDTARRRGYARTVLDTGPRQPHALALYQSAGYVELPPFNDSAASYFGEHALADN